jgi:hypothetical protein
VKIFIISLILINGKLLKLEIYEDCAIWFDKNVITHERKFTFKKENHYYHLRQWHQQRRKTVWLRAYHLAPGESIDSKSRVSLAEVSRARARCGQIGRVGEKVLKYETRIY